MSDEHTSFIKTPKQLIVVVVLAFAVPIGLIVLLSQLVTGVRPGGTEDSEAGVLNRIKPVGEVIVADASAPKGNMTGDHVYQTVCKTCHEAGLAGAPKIGDKSAWAPRVKTGVSALYTNAIKGKNAMPPKGGNAELADVEVQRAVVYMANRSGASFKEPAAQAAAPTPAVAAAATPAPATAATAAAAPPPVSKPGAPLDSSGALALMQKDGCAACHAIDKKVVGPAYQDVAAKYKDDKAAPTKLAQKVKAGGAGVWGPIPMPPNAATPDDDIKALVGWILTLKK